MIVYRYTVGNTTTETYDLQSVPSGVVYETIEIQTHTPTAEELIAEEFLKYQQRERDGMDAYLRISAEFRVAKISGQISEAEHKAIEELLIPVRDEIRAGQWISGLVKLEALGAQNIGVTLYDRLHLQISNYIAQCY